MEVEVVHPDQLEELVVPVKHDQPGNSSGEVEADGQALLLLLLGPMATALLLLDPKLESPELEPAL